MQAVQIDALVGRFDPLFMLFAAISVGAMQ